MRNAAGQVLVQGTATQSADGQWQYQATSTLPPGQPVVIEVTATDKPAHKGTKSQDWPAMAR